MGLLDTRGRWQLPQDSGATTTASGQTPTSGVSGWIDKGISIKTLEEAYYMFTGLQYNTSPMRITETQFAIAGITVPVHSHLILSVLEEPFCYMSEPLVIEPEKLIDWKLRASGTTVLLKESLRILGLVCGQHHELISATVTSGELA